jgi:hypothetical protein
LEVENSQLPGPVHPLEHDLLPLFGRRRRRLELLACASSPTGRTFDARKLLLVLAELLLLLLSILLLLDVLLLLLISAHSHRRGISAILLLLLLLLLATRGELETKLSLELGMQIFLT